MNIRNPLVYVVKNILLVVCAGVFVWSCSSGPKPKEIIVRPPVPEVGKPLSLTIEMTKPVEGITVEWNATEGKGKIKKVRQDGLAATYTPSELGREFITAEVWKNNKSLGVLTETIEIESTAAPNVLLITPEHNDRIPHAAVFKGTVQGDVGDWKIWIAILPDGTDKYHPLGQSARIYKTGKWELSGYVGASPDNPIDRGRRFDVFVLLSDEQANEELIRYHKEAAQKGSWDGLPSLPNTAVVVQKITVVRE